MGALSYIGHGFAIALSPANLLYLFLGSLMGTVIGVLPGIGPISGVAILIPFTFGMDPTTAMIMMAGVYYGAMYGGSTTSILINTPGENSSVVTCLDGYQMARQGRAGAALATAAVGSFIAGTISVILLMLMAPLLANYAIKFGPPEYVALMVLGLVAVASLGEGNMLKALISMAIGLIMATVGIDLQTGTRRFTFGMPNMLDGIDFLVLALGLFALAEVFDTASKSESMGDRIAVRDRLWLSKKDWKEATPPILRGSFLGFFLGILPGTGAIVASFMSYLLEKRLSKHPEKFGKGAIEGVAGPESANNAACAGALVPLLTLGLPSSATVAVMLGALMMFGIRPGPLLITEHPNLFWGLVASMYIGNALLLVLNLPLVGLFARMLDLPKNMLLPFIIAFSFLGVWATSTSTFDVVVLVIAGVLGYFMRQLDFPTAPMLLSLVLGDLLEQALRQSLTLSNGNPTVFFIRPISLVLLILAALFLLWPTFQKRAERRLAKETAA